MEAGRGCTLLVHEATFEPALSDQAVAKRHSTSREAMEASAAMGAYRTVLTHFSQRYPHVPAGIELQVRAVARDEGREPEMKRRERDGKEGGKREVNRRRRAERCSFALSLRLSPFQFPCFMPATCVKTTCVA